MRIFTDYEFSPEAKKEWILLGNEFNKEYGYTPAHANEASKDWMARKQAYQKAHASPLLLKEIEMFERDMARVRKMEAMYDTE